MNPTPVAAETNPGFTVGQVSFAHLPGELTQPTYESETEYEEVYFTRAAWERGNDTDGWSTDLSIVVMTGERLTDAQALYDWFVAYEERPAEDVDYKETTVNGLPGFVTADQIFWLLRPGLAASVNIDLDRYTAADLRATVDSATTQAESE